MSTDDFDFSIQRKPNVIWFLTDQMRAQAMDFMGDVNVHTPNLENLARNGINFTGAIAGAPWCCPFRASLLTSVYPHQNGVTRTPSALDPSVPVITAPFRDAGYHTAWIGKWHLDGGNFVSHYIPPQRRGGFDYFMGYENNNNQNECYVYGTDSETLVRLNGYETDSLTDMFIGHIKKHVAGQQDYQPFFGVLSVQPPHSPYVPPNVNDGSRRYNYSPNEIQLRPNVPPGKWAGEAKRDLAGYYGMIENIDNNLGRLRDALKEMRIDRETYIIFLSDHGDCIGSHAQWEKSTPYEEAVRIPFIVGCVGSGVHMRQGETDAILNHVDIAPTTLGLCGIDIPDWMKGYDYSPLCLNRDRNEYHQNENPAPESVYMQQIPRKYHRHSVNKAWRGVVTRDGWKYVCFPDHDWLLFNLNDDPYEMANLCHDTVFQKQKEKYHSMLEQWIKKTEDNFSLPDISIDRK